MINRIGVGQTFTVCVAAQLVALLGLAIQWRFGASWRRAAEVKRREPKGKQEKAAPDSEGV